MLTLALAWGALLAGCAARAVAPRDAGVWYVIRESRLEPGGPTQDATTRSEPLPWTVQARVADLLLHDGVLYLALNGLGLSVAPFPLLDAFETRNRDVFQGRTITEIFPDGDGLILHVYRNQILPDPLGSRSADPAPAFFRVGWSVAQPGEWEELTPPFQLGHPDWQPVAVVRVTGGVFAMEWKRTDDERTEFAYTRYSAATGQESTLAREQFRAAFAFAARSPDPTTEALFQAVIRAAKSGSTRVTAVHLVLRDGESTERLRHQPAEYATAPDVDLVVIPARRTPEALWALVPDGRLLAVAPGGKQVQTQRLPELPAGYRYTAFDVAVDAEGGARVAAAWEEARFTTVGEAGLYVGAVRLP